jgi:hypothetical protein
MQATELELGQSFISGFLAQCKEGGTSDCTLSLLSTAKLPALDEAMAALADALLAAVEGKDKAKVAGGCLALWVRAWSAGAAWRAEALLKRC